MTFDTQGGLSFSFRSARLGYRALLAADFQAFHRLASDAHIRRFLFDGELLSPEQCLRIIAGGQPSERASGLGLWLIYELSGVGEPIGFCGFHRFPELGNELELIFALLEPFTGRGYATEAAEAALERASQSLGRAVIRATVDEPNLRSLRVLQKLGFVECGAVAGCFGRILKLQREPRQ